MTCIVYSIQDRLRDGVATVRDEPARLSRARCAQHPLKTSLGGFSACDSQLLVTAAGPPAAVEIRFIKLRRL